MENFLIWNTLSFPILTVLIFLPLSGAIILLLLRNNSLIKWWALLVTLINMAISFSLFYYFDPSTYKFQFAEHHAWIPVWNINYTLGIDGISILLVLITAIIGPPAVLCSWRAIKHRVKEFMFCLLVMEAAMIGVFCSLDFVLFYVFWEAMLIPMYLLIAVWGGPKKRYASIKFFLYTLAGSVLLLVAMIALYLKAGTFSIPMLMWKEYPFNFQFWIFLAFFIAFAIKCPMFPFHTWLPAAHVEAPTAGSVYLASILLKMGTYGFLRFSLPITPLASHYFMPFMLWLSLASIIIGGYLAFAQSDMKKLIAYSSVGHMGFVTLGIFVMNARGIEGGILQMINHGINTGALFIMVGMIYERSHSRMIKDNSGIGKYMPIYVMFLGIFSLASFAFPGTNSFVGEILVLVGTFARNKVVGAFAIPGALLAAAYMLYLLQRIVWHTSPGVHKVEAHPVFNDLSYREKMTLGFLAIFVFWIGLNPGPFLNIMHVSVEHLSEQLNMAKMADVGGVTGMSFNEVIRMLFKV